MAGQHSHERRHSYVADSDTVRDSCVRDVLDCDAYVLILGHRYGFIPADANPRGLSITELEYDAAAGKSSMPVIVLKPIYARNMADTDAGLPTYAQVMAFHAKVAAKHRPAEFDSDAALLDALSLALERALTPATERADVQAILDTLTRVAAESAHKDAQIEAMRARSPSGRRAKANCRRSWPQRWREPSTPPKPQTHRRRKSRQPTRCASATPVRRVSCYARTSRRRRGRSDKRIRRQTRQRHVGRLRRWRENAERLPCRPTWQRHSKPTPRQRSTDPDDVGTWLSSATCTKPPGISVPPS